MWAEKRRYHWDLAANAMRTGDEVVCHIQAFIPGLIHNLRQCSLCHCFVQKTRMRLRNKISRCQMGNVKRDAVGFLADLYRLQQPMISSCDDLTRWGVENPYPYACGTSAGHWF